MPLLALLALATSQVPYESPLVGVWNYPVALTSVWALRVSRRPLPAGVVDLAPIARRTLPRYKVRVLTDEEAGTQSYKGGKLVFDGFRADTLDLSVRPVQESRERLFLCSVAVYRTVVRNEPGIYMETPLVIYQTIGYARGEGKVGNEFGRQLTDLGKAFVVGRKWAVKEARKAKGRGSAASAKGGGIKRP